MYLAEDLLPDGHNRQLSPEVLELVGKIPSSESNPYKKLNSSYLADYDMMDEDKRPEAMDPKLREELSNKDALMPENNKFAGQADIDKKPEKKRLVAIKKQRNISSLDGLEFSLLREIKLLQELNHVNVVKMYDVFHSKNLIYFALEYGPVDLGKLILKEKDIMLEPQHIKCMFKQLLEGLNYLHSNWIMHRDLKPGNVVISPEGILKLIDFNSAKIFGSPDRPHTAPTTTIQHRAPEQLFSSMYYGPALDIWSAGCIFAEMYLRDYLFAGQGQIDTLQKIFAVRGTPTKQNWPDVEKMPDYLEFKKLEPADLKSIFPMMTPQAIDLLDKCLQLDPNQRPSAQEALKHPYFTEEQPAACDPSELPIQGLQ